LAKASYVSINRKVVGQNQMRLRLYFAIILLLIAPASQALATIYLEPGTGKYDLGLHADILEDKLGELTIEQVSSAAYKSQWVKNQKPTLNFAFSDSVYWLRINIISEMQTSKTWWLEVAFALQDYIDYYLLHQGKIVRSTHTGDRVNFNSRSIDYRNFLFEFDISPNETRQIYIRLQSYDGLFEPCPIVLWDQQSFALASGFRNLGIGLYLGIMLAMVIYNLFIFIVVRDRAYAYYVIYIASFCFWITAYFGYSFQYWWPNSPNWDNQFNIISSCFWSIFMIQFIRSFLDTKRLVPWFDRLSKIVIAVLIFDILFSFTGKYSIGIQIIMGVGMPMCLATVIAGLICLKSGFKPAVYFLLAWSTLIISLVIFALRIAGLIPVNLITQISLQIGTAIEVIILSLGLAGRINELKNEKHLARKQAIQAFESSLKLKNDFITSISHELRTPMNAIIGGLEAMKKNTPGHSTTSLDIIQNGALDMMTLVNDILTHSEIQSKRLTIQSDHIDIQSLLKSLRKHYQHLSEDKGLQLDWQVDDTLPIWICTDQEKLVIIISKLLDNAIKFTEHGQVLLSIKCDQSTSPWQFIAVVKDTGIGIAQEKQDRIFESYTQLESGLQRGYGGLGIGLSICKKLSEALGGDLRLESMTGQGNSFTVILPIEPGVQSIIKGTTNFASADLPILIVEDNIVNQKVMIKLLEKIGHESVIANHGQEALEILEKEPVSLILMDLQMPVMDGLTCTAKIRGRDDQLKNIPIIAVTANLMDADKERCIECGMNDFLKKPITLDILRNCLSCYIAYN